MMLEEVDEKQRIWLKIFLFFFIFLLLCCGTRRDQTKSMGIWLFRVFYITFFFHMI
jgi:hypothetical protein